MRPARETLLLTGATGCIGTALVRALPPERSLCVVVRPDREASARERIRKLFPDREIEVQEGDLERPDLGLAAAELGRLRDRVGAIVHLAARTDFRDRALSPYLGPNLCAALAVGKLALAAGVPLLHASTAYVAGDLDGPFLETDLARGQHFHTPYEHSKWLAEQALLALSHQGLRLCRLRLGVVLPDAPLPGALPGPGPLVYLRLLHNLGRERAPGHVVRLASDPGATLNVVPSSWVIGVILDLLARDPESWAPCYHVTAARPLSMTDLQQALERAIPWVRLQQVAAGGPPDPDPLERLVQRRCAVYRPYHFLHTRWDRRQLERDLPDRAADGVDPAWLDGVFARHREAWSAGAPRPVPVPLAAQVHDYFARHLRERMGQLLIPGLSTLTRAFSIQVHGVGCWHLQIDGGRLQRVEPDAAPAALGYALEAAAFLRVVQGLVAPQSLFFAQAITIHGPVVEALSLATALEEFFQRHPLSPAGTTACRASGDHPASPRRKAS